MKAEELVEQWPKRWPRPTIGSTKNSHSQVKPFGRDFAGRELTSITREEVRRWALENRGRARYVRTMLYDALDAGLVEENVAAGLRIPALGSRQVTPPKSREVARLIEAARAKQLPTFADAIKVAAYTGIREGELRALSTEDLIYDRPAIDRPTALQIRYSLNRREELTVPKTRSSVGTCAILGPATEVRWTEWPEWAKLPTPQRERRIFRWTRSSFRDCWDTVRTEAGVDCRWHDLRHFCATWLLDRGASVDDVAVQLRCTVDEVRRTYGHPNRDEALKRLERLAEP